MQIVQYHIALYQAPDHLAACDQAEGTIMAITPRLGQDQTQAPAVREKEDDGNLPRGEDSALRKGSDHASSSDSFPSFALEPSGSAEGGGTGGEVPGRCDLHLRASAAVRLCAAPSLLGRAHLHRQCAIRCLHRMTYDRSFLQSLDMYVLI